MGKMAPEPKGFLKHDLGVPLNGIKRCMNGPALAHGICIARPPSSGSNRDNVSLGISDEDPKYWLKLFGEQCQPSTAPKVYRGQVLMEAARGVESASPDRLA